MRRLLSIATLLCALGALTTGSLQAQAPAGANDSQITLHKMFLKFVSPDAVLKRLRWEQDIVASSGPPPSHQGFGSGFAFRLHPATVPLPDGVKAIYAIEGNHSLLIFANQMGYDTVHDIVNTLDVKARQASLQVTFVMATEQDLNASGISLMAKPIPNLDGNSAVQMDTFEPMSALAFQAFLEKHPEAVTASRTVITADVPTTVDLRGSFRRLGDGGLVPADGSLQVVARINGDDTVTLRMSLQVAMPAGTQTMTGATLEPMETLETTRTVPSGETAPVSFPSAGKTGGRLLIIFITPTVVAVSPVPTAVN